MLLLISLGFILEQADIYTKTLENVIHFIVPGKF